MNSISYREGHLPDLEFTPFRIHTITLLNQIKIDQKEEMKTMRLENIKEQKKIKMTVTRIEEKMKQTKVRK